MKKKKQYVKKAKVHMSISVDGVLNRYKRKKINFCSHDDGRLMHPDDAKDIFLKAKSEGKRVLPMGDCYRFDYQNGCPGHITSLMPTDEKMAEIEAEQK